MQRQKTYPPKVALLGAVVTALVMVAFGSITWSVHRSELRERELSNLQRVLGRATSLDGSLTGAVRMEASLDPRDWSARHEQLELQMREAIGHISELAPRVRAEEAGERVEGLNVQLRAIDREALALAQQGRGAEAVEKLAVPEYVAAKGRMNQALAELSELAHLHLEEESRRLEGRLATAGLFFAFGALGLIGAWGLVMGRLRDYVAEHGRSQLRERQLMREAAAREAAEAAWERTRGILDSISDGFLTLDREWRITYLNRAASEMMVRISGRDPAEVLDKSLWEAFPELRGTRVERKYRQVIETGRPAQFEEYFDGWEAWFEIRVYPSEQGLSVSFRDITERRRSEEALRDSEERFRQLAENMNEVFWMFSPDFSETLYVSPAYESVFGLPCEGLYENPTAFLDVVHPDDRPTLLEMMAELAREPQSLVMRIERPDGQRRILHARGTPVRNAGGEIYRITGLTEDVTEQREMEQALRQRESQLSEAHRLAGLGSWEWDIQENRLTWSEGLYRIYGLDPEEFVPSFEAYMERIYPEDRAATLASVERMLEAKQTTDFEERIIRSDGSVRVVHGRSQVIVDEASQPLRVIGITQDITERKQAEEALRDSEERFRQLAENIEQVFWLTNADATQVLYLSPAYRTVWGREPDEVYEEVRNWYDTIHEDDRDRVRNLLAPERLQEGKLVAEFRIHRPDGEVRWISARGFPVLNEGGERYRFAGIADDITTPKRVEEALAEEARTSARFAAALENVTTGVLITDPARPDNPVIYANRGFMTVTGYKEEEVLGRNARLLQGPETDMHVVREIGRAVEEGRPFHGRVLNYCRDGTPFWNDMTISPVYDARGELINFVGLLSDITDQVKSEERLQEQVREKTALLAEVHHRVKNNLQIISSLLNMQIRSLRDPVTIEKLRESQNRTRAIALVHETLYRSGNYARVDLADYLGHLAQHLHRSLGIGEAVQLKRELQPVSVPLNQAVPCALILNELITNALKHAFPEGGRGEVRISLSEAPDGRCTLVVHDNGAGLSEEVDLENARSVGLQLIRMLSDQIGADIDLRRGAGTEFRFTFPIAEENSP